MKRILLLIAVAIAIAAAPGCNEAPLNGHLDGQWQIMTVEFPSGRVIRPDRYYFDFYRHTATLTHYGETSYSANLTVTDDSVKIFIPWDHLWLGEWGIERHTPYMIEYKVIDLSRKRLVMLWEDSVTFNFRKF